MKQVYSREDDNRNFRTSPLPTKELKNKAKLINDDFFKTIKGKKDQFILKFKNKIYELDLNEQICSCRNFIKNKQCCHLYKANLLFENGSEFVKKAKRGAPTKTKHFLAKPQA